MPRKTRHIRPIDSSDESRIPGRPGYRTRPLRTGLDPIDTNLEEARMEGMFLRNLFTGRLRTRNPFYLAILGVAGLALIAPAVFGIVVGLTEDSEGFACLVCPGPLAIIGIALLVNLGLSLANAPARRQTPGGRGAPPAR